MARFLSSNKEKTDTGTWSHPNIIYTGNKFVRRLKLPDNTPMKPESWKLAVDVFRLAKQKRKW